MAGDGDGSGGNGSKSDLAYEARIAVLMETIRLHEIRETQLNARTIQDRDPKLPSALTMLPGTPRSEDEYLHFRNNMGLAMECMRAGDDLDKRKCILLLGNISAEIAKLIREAADSLSYQGCVDALNKFYVREENDMLAKGELYRRLQDVEEDIDHFASGLIEISNKCNFQSFATAMDYRNDQLKTAFVNNVRSEEIKYQLLQEKELTWDSAVSKARDLERAKRDAASRKPAEVFVVKHESREKPGSDENVQEADPNGEMPMMAGSLASMGVRPGRFPFRAPGNIRFNAPFPYPTLRLGFRSPNPNSYSDRMGTSFNNAQTAICKWCGFVHVKSKDFCPANGAFCWECSMIGHFRKYCPNKKVPKTSLNVAQLYLANDQNDSKLSWVELLIRGVETKGLLDSGASRNFISKKFWDKIKSNTESEFRSKIHEVEFANGKVVQSFGECEMNMMPKESQVLYPDMSFVILKDLCAPIILGRDFLGQHKEVIFEYESNS